MPPSEVWRRGFRVLSTTPKLYFFINSYLGTFWSSSLKYWGVQKPPNSQNELWLRVASPSCFSLFLREVCNHQQNAASSRFECFFTYTMYVYRRLNLLSHCKSVSNTHFANYNASNVSTYFPLPQVGRRFHFVGTTTSTHLDQFNIESLLGITERL